MTTYLIDTPNIINDNNYAKYLLNFMIYWINGHLHLFYTLTSALSYRRAELQSQYISVNDWVKECQMLGQSLCCIISFNLKQPYKVGSIVSISDFKNN